MHSNISKPKKNLHVKHEKEYLQEGVICRDMLKPTRKYCSIVEIVVTFMLQETISKYIKVPIVAQVKENSSVSNYQPLPREAKFD